MHLTQTSGQQLGAPSFQRVHDDLDACSHEVRVQVVVESAAFLLDLLLPFMIVDKSIRMLRL